MRNLEKGQHIFIAFQNGKAVLDSQLRPRIYTSLENADKWTPTVNKGKIEYVEYAPTLTPPNEPLMPDELKEMGGEPVWTVGVSYTGDGEWAMWDIVEKADNEGVDFGYSTESREWWNYNLRDKDGKLLSCAWVCYRCPPE